MDQATTQEQEQAAANTVPVPNTFFTIKDIDSLSMAGIGVWIICVVAESIIPNLNSFKLRIVAISFSFLWALCHLFMSKKWRNPVSYFILFINAGLIFVNAAGMNSVTRQDPFAGKNRATNLDDIKADSIQKAGIFDFSHQQDWYPDYQMFYYIDTLQKEISFERDYNKRLKNLFYYFKDRVKTSTKEQNVIDLVNSLNLENDTDTGYLQKMKGDYEFKINNLKHIIEDKDFLISLYSKPDDGGYSIQVGGKKFTVPAYVRRSDSLENVNSQLIDELTNLKKQITDLNNRLKLPPKDTTGVKGLFKL